MSFPRTGPLLQHTCSPADSVQYVPGMQACLLHVVINKQVWVARRSVPHSIVRRILWQQDLASEDVNMM